MKFLSICAACAVFLLNGCASILSGTKSTFTVDAGGYSDAEIYVSPTGNQSALIFVGVGSGSFVLPKTQLDKALIVVKKPGCADGVVVIAGQIDPTTGLNLLGDNSLGLLVDWGTGAIRKPVQTHYSIMPICQTPAPNHPYPPAGAYAPGYPSAPYQQQGGYPSAYPQAYPQPSAYQQDARQRPMAPMTVGRGVPSSRVSPRRPSPQGADAQTVSQANSPAPSVANAHSVSSDSEPAPTVATSSNDNFTEIANGIDASGADFDPKENKKKQKKSKSEAN